MTSRRGFLKGILGAVASLPFYGGIGKLFVEEVEIQEHFLYVSDDHWPFLDRRCGYDDEMRRRFMQQLARDVDRRIMQDYVLYEDVRVTEQAVLSATKMIDARYTFIG